MADSDVVPAGEGNLLSAIANPQDPMKQWGGMPGVLNLFSQRAIGQAYQNALNPETGQIDVPTFNNAIINNPLSRLKAQEALQGVGQANFAQQQAMRERINVQNATNGQIRGLLQPLMDMDHVPKEMLQQKLDEANKMGLGDPTMRAKVGDYLAGLPPGADVKPFVNGLGFSAQDIDAAQANYLPQPATHDLGPVILTGATGARAGAHPGAFTATGEPLWKGYTPGQEADIIGSINTYVDGGWKDPDNPAKRKYGLAGQMWKDLDPQHRDPYEMFKLQPPSTAASSQPWTTEQQSKITPPAPVSSAAGTAAPPAGTPTALPETAPPGTPPVSGTAPAIVAQPAAGPTTTGGAVPPPTPALATPAPTPPKPDASRGYEAAPEKDITDSNAAYGTAAANKIGVSQRISPIESARAAMLANPGMQTVGHEGIYQATQVLSAFGAPVPTSMKTNADANQEVAKYLRQYLMNIPGLERSDLERELGESAVAHMGQSRNVILTLLAKAEGLEIMRGMPYDYFVKQHGGDQYAARNDSGNFIPGTAAVQGDQDPTAYGVHALTPEAYKEYVGNLTGFARERFIKSRKLAQQLYPNIQPVAPTTPARAAPGAAAPAASPWITLPRNALTQWWSRPAANMPTGVGASAAPPVAIPPPVPTPGAPATGRRFAPPGGALGP